MGLYIITSYDVVNPDRYKSFPSLLLHQLIKHRAEILMSDFLHHPQTGQVVHVKMVLAFPSENELENWYNDPEYSRVVKICHESTANGYTEITHDLKHNNGWQQYIGR